MEDSRIWEVAMKGSWLYDNSVKRSVRILRQDWDYYYEDGYSDGPPHLNSDGLAFYVVFDEPREDGHFSSRSETLNSLPDAINYAKEKIVGEIIWD